MDELDEGGGLDVRRTSCTSRSGLTALAAAAGPAGEYHQQRAQPLAAARNDVFSDLIDQRDHALEAAADGRIHRFEVGPHQLANGLQRSRGPGGGLRGAGWCGFQGPEGSIQLAVSPRKTRFDRAGHP